MASSPPASVAPVNSCTSAVSAIGWPSSPALLAQELVHQVIGKPPRHPQEPVETGSSQAGDPAWIR
jgi:hypothetical protein